MGELVSVVVPVCNEEANLPELRARLVAALADHEFECILVDDGSTDATPVIIRDFVREDPRFKLVSLSRNFGHQAAIFAGLTFARGARVAEGSRGRLRRPRGAQRGVVHPRDGGDLLPCSGAPLEDHDAARLRRLRGDGPPGRGSDRRHPRAPPLSARAQELGRLPSGRVSLRARSPPQGQGQVHGLAAPGSGGLGDRVVFRRPAPAGGARGRHNLGALARGRTCRAARADAGPRRRRGRACVLLRSPAPGDRHARRVRRPCPRGGSEPPDLRRRRGRRVGSDPGRARSRGRMNGRTALRLAACLGLSAVLAFYQLGERPLSSPAEARYALIARAMLDDGDWVQPRLNGVRYYEKPPLLYWSVAASYRLFGQTEGASRVPSAAAYVATVAVTFFLARELLGAATAPLAALVFATSAGPFLYGRFLFTDTLFVLWLAVSLLGLVVVARGQRGPLGPLLFWGGLSLAGLTKGLAGLVFPLGTAATCALLFGPMRLLRDLRPRLGAAIVAVVLVPWHLLLGARDPDFLRFYLVNEHLPRFFNAREPIDYSPLAIGGFWLASALSLLPWSLFLPAALASPDLRKALALPLVWSAWVIAFFTTSGSRLEYYALPAFPALAVVVAAYWRGAIDTRPSRAGVRVPAWMVLFFGVAVLSWLVVFRQSAAESLTSLLTLLDGVYREYFAHHREASFAFVEGCLRLVLPFAVFIVVLGGAAVLASRLPRA